MDTKDTATMATIRTACRCSWCPVMLSLLLLVYLSASDAFLSTTRSSWIRYRPLLSSLDDETVLSSIDFDEDDSSMGAWVPVGSVSCLSGLDPVSVQIFGRKFVVWQDAKRQWSVLKDECPHRMAPLSLGRKTTNCIECPYHGWQFDRNGTLTVIPHINSADNLQAASRSVESFATQQTGDLLWAFLPTSMHGESFPSTLLPRDYYQALSAYTNATFYTQELPFSFDFLIENALDGPAHAYFAHHSLGFDRNEAGALPSKIVVSNFTQLTYETEYQRRGQIRRRRYGFQRPFLITNQVPRGSQWQAAILLFAVPVGEGKTRIITTFDTLSPHPATPDWMLHILNQRFLEGDLMLHDIEITLRSQKDAVAPKYIYATSSDLAVKAWRRWWQTYGLSASPPQSFGPAVGPLTRMSREQLTNPYAMHTKHCRKCRTALRRSKKIQGASLVLAWGGLALWRSNRGLAVLLGLIGTVARLLADRVVRELEGPASQSQVSDRSLSAST